MGVGDGIFVVFVTGGSGRSATSGGFGFGSAQGVKDDAVGVGIDFCGFGDSDEEVDDAGPFVASGDEVCASGGGIGGSEACFFVFEGAELFSDLDPFVDELGEGSLFVFGSDEDFVELAADFGSDQ